MCQEITLKVALIKGTEKQEQTISISRDLFNSLLTKDKLLSFVFNDVFKHLGDKSDIFFQKCRAERKSKKHKKFVPLETSEDFKELMRSLKVKNHVKLLVYSGEVEDRSFDSPVTEALEQMKKLVTDLQKSEIWDVLKSLANTYNVQLPSNVIKRAAEQAANDASTQSHNTKPPGDFYDGEYGWVVHGNIACDSCHPGETFADICGVRYKCGICKNFDLCGKCYARKVELGNHHPDHPMIAISDSLVYRQYFDTAASRCPAAGTAAVRSLGNDIFYDIPLENCSLQNRHIIESMLSRESISEFFRDVNGFIERANKYSVIESLVPSNDLDKFSLLKEFLENSQPDCKEVQDKSTVSFVSLEELHEGKLDVILENTSTITIIPGELNLNFVDDDGYEIASCTLSIPKEIIPGGHQTFHLDLGRSVTNLSGSTVAAIHSDGSLFLQGKYGRLTKLSFVSLTGPEVVEDQPVPAQLEFRNGDNIQVEVVPRSNGLSQLIISNQSAKTIDCSNLDLEIVNCLDTVVSSVSIQKKHGILPERVAKFNLPVNNAHFKFPFKVVLRNEHVLGTCNLSMKNLIGNFEFSVTTKKSSFHEENKDSGDKIEENFVEDTSSTQETEDDSITTPTAFVMGDEDLSEDESNSFSGTGGSYHSIVIPTLPKESSMESSQATAEFQDVEDLGDVDPSDEDDYDMISVGDADDVASDFEVLSPINSFEN